MLLCQRPGELDREFMLLSVAFFEELIKLNSIESRLNVQKCRSDLQASLSACSAAVHEFRIPSKALLGLHSYLPIHFDAFHSVLVEASVHLSLLKGDSYAAPAKLPRFDYSFSPFFEKDRSCIKSKEFL